MVKPVKIDDVKRPDKVAPSSSSRPILVTNRPTLKNDPMMTPDDTKSDDDDTRTQPMSHSPKIIAPVSADLLSSSDDSDEKSADSDENKVEDEQANDNTQSSEATGKADSEEVSSSEPDEDKAASSGSAIDGHGLKSAELPVTEIKPPSSDDERDPEAEVTAQEIAIAEAEAKREEEVEGIIASGKYVVPINAIERRRSRTATALLVLLAVVLAVILADAVADVGIVHVPASFPHTHFFSKN
jgi:hypothetical protein